MSNPERHRPSQKRRRAVIPEIPWWKGNKYRIAVGLSAASLVGGSIFAYTRNEVSQPASTATVVVFGPQAVGPEQSEFTGEVEETKALIKQWNAEVGADQQKLEQYMPRITQLAAAYFSNQMAEMFPQKSAQYNKQALSAVFTILDEQSFAKKAVNCSGKPFDSLVPAFNDEDGKIYLNLQRLWKGMMYKQNAAETAMLMSVHELMHNAAPRVKHNPPVMIEGSAKSITSQKGLILYAEEKDGIQCSASVSYWTDQEEIVVEDGITDLMQRIDVVNRESRYMPLVNNYRNRVLIIPGINRQMLLERQQSSDVIGFIRSIGKAVMGESSTRVKQINVGGNIAKSLTQ